MENGLFLTASNSKQFPFLILKNNPIPSEGDYYIKVTYEFPLASFFGDGFGIGNIVPNYGSSQNEITNVDSDFIQFHIWRSLTDLHVFQTRHCLTLLLCDSNRTTLFQKSYTDTIHTLELQYVGSSFIVYSDGSEINNPALLDSERRPTVFWIGNPVKLNSPQDWTSLSIKNVQIGKIIEVAEIKNPVIIIPGFGGSWDLGAILAGTTGTHWEIPTFIKNYDGIIQSFENAGYVEGTDLFVFPYDWRKPLSSLADDLNSFIVSKNLTEKADLIGHSMGGLVARSYAQKYGVDSVNKIMTVGSPNMGVIDAYGLWEGAQIWGGAWWQHVLLEIATEVNRLPSESKVAAVRRVSPSIIDLFPTFTFLSMSDKQIELEDMSQKNSYLSLLNSDVSALTNLLTPFWSEDVLTTKKGVAVIPRSSEDATEEKWEDGRPVEGDPFAGAVGDGTVTKDSALGPFGTGEKVAGWHGDLLSSQENIGKIFQKIGLDPSLAVSSETDGRTKSLVVILRSPGTLEVCDTLLTNCDNQLGLYFSEHKLFILPGHDDEDLRVRVKESGLGQYKLHIGSISSEGVWKSTSGELKREGQIDNYFVDGATTTMTPLNNSPILDEVGGKSVDEFATLSITLEASDIDGQELEFAAENLPSNATFDTPSKTFTFTPDETQGGETYSVTFGVSDGVFDDQETISISVKEVNNAPVASDDEFVTKQNMAFTIATSELLANDSDQDNQHDDLTVIGVSEPVHGEVSLSDQEVTFTPSLDYSGLASFSYSMTDGLTTRSATVGITVSASPVLSDEVVGSTTDTGATITWQTDHVSTSRVIYDTVSHPTLATAPNYGYSSSTIEIDNAPMVSFHTVTLSDLSANTTYYYRVVSHGSSEVVGEKKSFTTKMTNPVSNAVAAISNGSSGTPPETCSDKKPGSAPVLTNASSSTPNQVTLTWTKATNPVTYYLVAYGTKPGEIHYGNPNVGGAETSSYTVKGLSGGQRYYFQVRAGNGCAPGEYSNELSTVVLGTSFTGVAENFAPEVLGESVEAEPTEATPSATRLPTPSGTVLGETKDKNEDIKWWTLSLLVVFLYFGSKQLLKKE